MFQHTLMTTVMLVLCLLLPHRANAGTRVGLMLEYLFDDPSRAYAVDTSGQSLHGVFVGSDIHFGPGRVGYGLAFNGIDDFIRVGNHISLQFNKYTLMAWIKYQPSVGGENLEIMEDADSYWLNVRPDTRKLRGGGFFGRCSSSSFKWRFVDSATPIPSGKWIHVASTYNGSALKVYVNGVLSAQGAVSGTVCVNTNPLIVGAKHDVLRAEAPRNFFHGWLDEVRLYNRALSKSEIQGLMAQP